MQRCLDASTSGGWKTNWNHFSGQNNISEVVPLKTAPQELEKIDIKPKNVINPKKKQGLFYCI